MSDLTPLLPPLYGRLPANLAPMRELAANGRGLSTYISRHVGDRYARKWR